MNAALVELPSVQINAVSLLQHVSRVDYRGDALYFGCNGTNRYDDPLCGYGVLYLAANLRTALMESVFHKHQWYADTRRPLALAEIRSRLVRAVGVLHPLRLADLTAPGIMAGYFGLNLELLSTRDYTHTHRVSAHVHALCDDRGRPRFDGIFYPSRNDYPATSIALFQRAAAKVMVVADIDLVDHAHWPAFVALYRIAVEPDSGPVMPD